MHVAHLTRLGGGTYPLRAAIDKLPDLASNQRAATRVRYRSTCISSRLRGYHRTGTQGTFWPDLDLRIRLPAPRLYVFVGDDDGEVKDGHEDHEVDNCRDERAPVPEGLLVARLAKLDAEADRVAALSPVKERVNNIGSERLDQRAYR